LGIIITGGEKKGKDIYDAVCHGKQSTQPRRALQESGPLSALPLVAPYILVSPMASSFIVSYHKQDPNLSTLSLLELHISVPP
jgi:hypothetical protein